MNKIFKILAAMILALVLIFPFYGCRDDIQQTVTTEVKSVHWVPEPEPIPQEILDMIDEADSFYGQEQYGEANKGYRDAILALERLDREDTGELLAELDSKYRETREIVDAARLHHGNAMKLQYEKRFEEALRELEMALEIYPQYQAARDALDMLKALEGLSSLKQNLHGSTM